MTFDGIVRAGDLAEMTDNKLNVKTSKDLIDKKADLSHDEAVGADITPYFAANRTAAEHVNIVTIERIAAVTMFSAVGSGPVRVAQVQLEPMMVDGEPTEPRMRKGQMPKCPNGEATAKRTGAGVG